MLQNVYLKMSRIIVYVDEGINPRSENDNSVYIADALSSEHNVLFTSELPSDLSSYDAIFLRKDTPKNHYSDVAFPANLVQINDSTHMKYFDSKLSLIDFYPYIPDSVVVESSEEVLSFLKSNLRAVLKPEFSYGGKGITLVDLHTDADNLDQYFSKWGRSLCQEYLPGVSKGDKRIILIDGVPTSALLRKSQGGLCNVTSGGTTEVCDILPLEKRVCEELSDRLTSSGQLIVGLDFIDSKLSEINVSSVGLLRRADMYNNNLNNLNAIRELVRKYV